jgi:hypothetical protein
MSFASPLLTTPLSRYISPFLQNIAAPIASRAIAHMRASHVQREQRTLNLNNLGRHVGKMLSLEAIEVRVSVIGLDGICGASVWVYDWYACHKAREPFRRRALRTAHSQGVDRVLRFSFAERIEVRHV